MVDKASNPSAYSRREVIQTSAALAAGATALASAGAASARAPARWRRINVTDPAAGKVLDSYQKAIKAMLALPSSDPRNWYRHALVHTIDCPHGNWWFPVWHRGYIGWFEQVCRDLSGDPDFALPYWDWTATPEVPAPMFEGVLNPSNPTFIATLDEFNKTFDPVLETMWKAFTPDQINQLLIRGLRFPADLEFDIGYPQGPMFFPQAQARGIKANAPHLDAPTSKSVSLPTLLDALGPRDYITFGSSKTFFHSGITGFGVMEGQPHNKVHNNTGGIITTYKDGKPVTVDLGGFMQSNLSPVDPLFFLHHANIDRIWDLWTRKQLARGYPIFPDGYPGNAPGSDYNLWSSEPFLFFTGVDGKPVAGQTAGAYQSIGQFNYDYQPGSGEEIVPKVMLGAGAAPPGRAVQIAATPPSKPGGGHKVTLPKSNLLSAGKGEGPKFFAKITLVLPPHGSDVAVMINAPDGTTTADPNSPQFAGTLTMFGHHVIHGPVTFTVALSQPLATLAQKKLLSAEAPIDIKVLPVGGSSGGGMMMAAPHGDHGAGPSGASVISVVVEAH